MAKDLRSATPVEKFSFRKHKKKKAKAKLPPVKRKGSEEDMEDMSDMGITMREGLDSEETAHILDSEEQARERKRRFKVPM